MNSYTHETYLSPLTWRYGSDAMRRIWSEWEKRRLLRRFWVALAEAQAEFGLVREDQVADLREHECDVDIARSAEIEAEIGHDLMAEIKTYAEQCPTGGAIIHLGATSMDVLDNVDALRLRSALDLLLERLASLLQVTVTRMQEEVATLAIAFTHIQPAEPTTVGYRLAQYAQDLLEDYHELKRVRTSVRGKGLKGAVGTSASYTLLMQQSGRPARDLESAVMQRLDLEAFEVSTQTYPRKQDWRVLCALAGVGATLHKLAFDVRILQSPPIGEWSEPFGEKQVGSSAMPFKRNPVAAENIDSLARLLATLPRVAWDNAALNLLERTLDDSANRRLTLAYAFLITDEILSRTDALLRGLQIWPGPTKRNLQTYGLFAATERVMMAAARAGGDRQELHEVIRQHSLTAWASVQEGQPNPLQHLLAGDERITRYLSPHQLGELLDATAHVGDAAERTLRLAETIQRDLVENSTWTNEPV